MPRAMRRNIPVAASPKVLKIHYALGWFNGKSLPCDGTTAALSGLSRPCELT